jgi:hypothetical protein
MKDRLSYKEYRESINGLKPSKMRNIKTEVDGIIFDSQKEANHYRLLKMKKKEGFIIDFLMQVPFIIHEGYWKGNERVKPVWYKADFYVIRRGISEMDKVKTIIEIHEVKGRWTEVAKVKRKMFEKRYPEYEMVII